MKEITIKVPNKSVRKEFEVLDAIQAVIKHFEKTEKFNIEFGQGGNIESWDNKDLPSDGILMLIKVGIKKK